MLPEADITIHTVHERENHRQTQARHYSRSGEPPTAFMVGILRRFSLGWRETYRQTRKVNGRIELDGSGVSEPAEAYKDKRKDINRLLCSYLAIQLYRN